VFELGFAGFVQLQGKNARYADRFIAVLWDSSLARFRSGPLPTKKPLWYLGDLYSVRSPLVFSFPFLGLPWFSGPSFAIKFICADFPFTAHYFFFRLGRYFPNGED
jgi:hypothetical protein